jgi:hypothetical protein
MRLGRIAMIEYMYAAATKNRLEGDVPHFPSVITATVDGLLSSPDANLDLLREQMIRQLCELAVALEQDLEGLLLNCHCEDPWPQKNGRIRESIRTSSRVEVLDCRAASRNE